MNDRTLNPEAVGDAVQELGVLDDAGVVTRVLLLDGLYLELAPAIHRGLVDPGCLLALEKPPRVRRDRAGVGATQVDLQSLKYILSSDQINLFSKSLSKLSRL